MQFQRIVGRNTMLCCALAIAIVAAVGGLVRAPLTWVGLSDRVADAPPFAPPARREVRS